MSSPSKAPSQTFAYSSSNGENHLSGNDYYPTIVVENATTATLAVAVDGGTATTGATTHELAVGPNSTASFPNAQPLPNANVPGTDYSGGPGVGWTAQKGYVGTAMTVCSVIPQASTSGSVTVSFQ